MKSFNKILSILVAVTMVFAMSAVALSVSVSAESEKPVYVQTFTKENFLGYYAYSKLDPETTQDVDYDTESKDVTFNADGSFSMDCNSYTNNGMRAVFSIDDEFKKQLAEAKKIADAKYQENYKAAEQKAKDEGKEFKPESVAKVNPGYNFYFRIDKSKVKKGYMKDAFVFYGFVKNDGTLLPSTETGGNAYRTVKQSFSMRYKTFNGNHIADGEYTDIDITDEHAFDDIKGIFFEVYHWNAYDKAATITGFTLTGEPEMPEFPLPEVDPDATTQTVVSWDLNNKQDYGNGPDAIKYSEDNGATVEYSKTKSSGWMKWENREHSSQFQTYFFFDRDDFNKGILIANKEGGSKKWWITFQLDACVDNDGNDCLANIQVQIVDYSKGYVMVIDEWQKPGTSKTYAIDSTLFDINSVAGVKCAVQNYWYYDAENNLVEYPTKNEKDPEYDTSGNSIPYGTGLKRVYICPQVCISPITVAPVGVEPTSVELTTNGDVQTTTVSNDNPGAGFHFVDFLPETQAKSFGNSPEEVTYPEYTEKPGVDKLYDPEYGRAEIKSPTRINKQHQMGWYIYSTDDGESIIDEAVSKRTYNQMKQALAYAQGPGGLNLLCCDVTVISAKHAATKEDCSVQAGVMIHAAELQSVETMKWCNPGQSVTLKMDVSELELDNISLCRLNPMNYANVDPDSGNACGLTGLDVIYSAFYVAGNQFATEPETFEPGDAKEAERIWKLYQALPNSFNTEADVAKLEAFIYAYADASVATQELLEARYGLTMDDYGTLLELYNSLGGFFDPGVDTGAGMAAPIAALVLAAAAGFVMVKSKKK